MKIFKHLLTLLKIYGNCRPKLKQGYFFRFFWCIYKMQVLKGLKAFCNLFNWLQKQCRINVFSVNFWKFLITSFWQNTSTGCFCNWSRSIVLHALFFFDTKEKTYPFYCIYKSFNASLRYKLTKGWPGNIQNGQTHNHTNPTKWSNTLKQFVDNSWRIVWECLTILWGWRLKG